MRRAELARCAARAAVLASLMTAACGTIAPQVAYPNVQSGPLQSEGLGEAAETPGRWAETLAGLRADDQRVADVAFRIVTANVELCSDVKPRTGLVLQSALEYSPSKRPHAEAEFHVDDRATVEAVAAGSPGAEARLRLGDVIVAVDGQPLATGAPAPPSGADDRPATYAPVENAESAIDAALARGPARLQVRRGAEELDVMLTPRPGCAYDAHVLPGPALNASADGRHVFISAGLVDYARSDDALALCLGHEFAHDLLHHHQREDEKGFARNLLGEYGASPASHMVAEKEADYVGLYLTARAGYDISRAPEFYRRVPAIAGDLGLTHPDNAERAAALTATRDEILAKRQRGEPLVPNPAPSGTHVE
jgi:hypothetical protein